MGLQALVSNPTHGVVSAGLQLSRQCISEYDFNSAMNMHEQDPPMDGLLDLPDEYMQVVDESFAKGEVVKPPELALPPTPAKSRKPRTKKAIVISDDDYEMTEDQKPKKSRAKKKVDAGDEKEEAPKPKRNRKKRAIEEVDVSEEEYVPKKTRSRQAPMEEEIDPAVANIQALAEKMRKEAGK